MIVLYTQTAVWLEYQVYLDQYLDKHIVDWKIFPFEKDQWHYEGRWGGHYFSEVRNVKTGLIIGI